MYLGFHWTDFPGAPYLELSTRAIEKSVIVASIDQLISELYLENKVTFRLYLPFQCRDFIYKLHLVLSTHALKTM
jgi:hypothetical protein